MNNEPDQLDGLLQRWASQHEPSAERLLQLRQHIIERSQAPADVASPSVCPAERKWSPAARLALAVALSGVVLVVASILWPESQQRPLATRPPAAVQQIPRRHLHGLLAEMQQLFGHRLAWVAETDRDFSLGIDEGDSQELDAAHVAVHVVVFQRSAGQDKWRPIWQGDVLTRAEELIHVTSSNDSSQWSLWTHVLPDGAVSIDTELAVAKGNLAAWKSTSVQQPEVPCQVAASEQGGDEFQVWQTAAIVPNIAVPDGTL
jgi:hypothetical protein